MSAFAGNADAATMALALCALRYSASIPAHIRSRMERQALCTQETIPRANGAAFEYMRRIEAHQAHQRTRYERLVNKDAKRVVPGSVLADPPKKHRRAVRRH